MESGHRPTTADVTIHETTLHHLSPEERNKLYSCLQDAKLLAREDSYLGSTVLVKHAINTSDHPVIKQPPRRIPFALRNHVDEMMKQMKEKEVIQPSKTPWASPIVLVAKKDGTTRFCVDYCRVDAITKMDMYPYRVLMAPLTYSQDRGTSPPWIWHLDTGKYKWLMMPGRRQYLSSMRQNFE